MKLLLIFTLLFASLAVNAQVIIRRVSATGGTVEFTGSINSSTNIANTATFSSISVPADATLAIYMQMAFSPTVDYFDTVVPTFDGNNMTLLYSVESTATQSVFIWGYACSAQQSGSVSIVYDFAGTFSPNSGSYHAWGFFKGVDVSSLPTSAVGSSGGEANEADTAAVSTGALTGSAGRMFVGGYSRYQGTAPTVVTGTTVQDSATNNDGTGHWLHSSISGNVTATGDDSGTTSYHTIAGIVLEP